MKKFFLLSLFCLCIICPVQNIFAQNGACIPPVGLDCITAPKFIDSVWTTNANIDFNNWGTGCSTQDQNYTDYFNSRRAYVYFPGNFDLHIRINPVAVAFIAVWIDWNDDLIFGSGEQVYLSSGLNSAADINVVYPNINDTVILRVRTGTTAMGPCDSIDAGETEDYSLVVFPSTQGIIQPPENSSWTIFPNPAENSVCVNLPNNASSAKVEMLDVLGNVLYYNTTSSEKADIDLSALPHGMYFVKITSGGKSSEKKFVH